VHRLKQRGNLTLEQPFFPKKKLKEISSEFYDDEQAIQRYSQEDSLEYVVQISQCYIILQHN
jgi:hypothetical protein